VRAAACDAERHAGTWSDWKESVEPAADLAAPSAITPGDGGPDAKRPFLVAEAEVDRGGGFSRAIRIYVAPASGRVIAVER
jgi:hypothetical protein